MTGKYSLKNKHPPRFSSLVKTLKTWTLQVVQSLPQLPVLLVPTLSVPHYLCPLSTCSPLLLLPVPLYLYPSIGAPTTCATCFSLPVPLQPHYVFPLLPIPPLPVLPLLVCPLPVLPVPPLPVFPLPCSLCQPYLFPIACATCAPTTCARAETGGDMGSAATKPDNHKNKTIFIKLVNNVQKVMYVFLFCFCSI